MKTERLEMRVASDWLAEIDEWRRRQPDLPPRAEAIRRLVRSALDAEQRPSKARRTAAPAEAGS